MSLENITFIDIETVPETNPEYVFKSEELTVSERLFTKKFDRSNEIKEGVTIEEFYGNNAALYAEFGKVVCVSLGTLRGDKFYIKTISIRDEVKLLEVLSEALMKSSSKILVAHNGMDFDYPFLFRRYLVNGVPVPAILNTTDKKPWDVPLADTLKMWSGTQWNYKVSLEMLCHLFKLPSPKALISGASVSDIYYLKTSVDDSELPFDKEDSAMRKIGEYCAGDVIALANVYCKIKNLALIDQTKIEYVK